MTGYDQVRYWSLTQERHEKDSCQSSLRPPVYTCIYKHAYAGATDCLTHLRVLLELTAQEEDDPPRRMINGEDATLGLRLTGQWRPKYT
jgi:hypothetical protein